MLYELFVGGKLWKLEEMRYYFSNVNMGTAMFSLYAITQSRRSMLMREWAWLNLNWLGETKGASCSDHEVEGNFRLWWTIWVLQQQITTQIILREKKTSVHLPKLFFLKYDHQNLYFSHLPLRSFLLMNGLYFNILGIKNKSHTFQRCTRFQLGKSTHGTWTAAWRRSPCECCPTPRGCWRCSPAGGGWPAGSRPAHRHAFRSQTHSPNWTLSNVEQSLISGCVCWPGESCRRTSRSWWRPPRVFASRYCSWTSSAGNLRAGSTQKIRRLNSDYSTVGSELCVRAWLWHIALIT